MNDEDSKRSLAEIRERARAADTAHRESAEIHRELLAAHRENAERLDQRSRSRRDTDRGRG